MKKSLVVTTLSVLAALAANAHAASTDVVFKGGATITSTASCPDWNPAKDFLVGTFWAPVAGSTNGPDTVITFHGFNSSEGFQLSNGALGAVYKAVKGYHIYTRVGTYNASIKIASQSPAIITTATQKVVLNGTVKGWGFQTSCVANFTMALTRDLQP